MMHFFRRSKIHLDCFTSRRDVIEYAPVVNAIEAMPDWWKNLPKNSNTHFFPTPTMKTCSGIIGYYKNSVALPLWSDLCIDVADGEFRWQFSDEVTKGIAHEEAQYRGFIATKNYRHLKIDSPWLFQTKEDINWLLTDPIYNRTSLNDYVTPPGALSFLTQHTTNIQLLIDLATPRRFILPFKTTFLFTPLSDKKVVVHRHLIGEEEYRVKNARHVRTTFLNAYINQQRVVKCPYKDETK